MILSVVLNHLTESATKHAHPQLFFMVDEKGIDIVIRDKRLAVSGWIDLEVYLVGAIER